MKYILCEQRLKEYQATTRCLLDEKRQRAVSIVMQQASAMLLWLKHINQKNDTVKKRGWLNQPLFFQEQDYL